MSQMPGFKGKIRELATTYALDVSIVDGSGTQITSFGGGTQYTEGDTDTSITGTAVMWEDAGDTLKAVSSANPLPVNIVAGSSSGTEYTEGDIDATPTGTVMMGRISGDDSLHAIVLDANKYQMVTAGGGTIDSVTTITNPVTVQATNLDIRDLTSAFDSIAAVQSGTWTVTGFGGTFPITDSGGSITVDNGGTFAVQESGAALTSLQLIDDAIGTTSAAIPTKTMVVGISDGTNVQIPRAISSNLNTASLGIQAAGLVAQLDDVSPTTITENQFGVLRMTGTRALHGSIRDAAGNERGANVNASSELNVAIAASAANIAKAEDVASANADVGVPAMAIRKATPANTSGTDGDYEMLQMSAGRLWTSAAIDTALPAGTNVIGKVGHDITGIGHGVKTVTTAGTDEALAASTACKRVVIQAQTDNTSGIAVGGSGVDATVATGSGVYLNPGDTFELEIDNLADVYVDSLVNGEGVRYTYFT